MDDAKHASNSRTTTDDRSVPDWGPAQGPPTDPERAEDAFDLKFGDVVHAIDGHAWAFIGWRRNTAGRSAWFAREQTEWERAEPFTYNASHADTIERKFPDIASRRQAAKIA